MPLYTWNMTRSAAEIDELFDAALNCMERGDSAGAVTQFEAVLQRNGSHVEARHGLIRALEDAGRVHDALAAVQSLIAADPDDVLAQTRLSMIFQRKGMIAEAEAAAAKAKILGWKQELRSGVSPKTDL